MAALVLSCSALALAASAQSTSCFGYGKVLNTSAVSDSMHNDMARVIAKSVGVNTPGQETKTYLAGFEYTFLFPTMFLQALYETSPPAKNSTGWHHGMSPVQDLTGK